MNWLDWLLAALLAAAAVRGFFRGFVVEAASLFGIVLGIWAASRFNHRVAMWMGWGGDHEVISFLITFVAVLVAVHLIAKAITKAMDLAMLSLPNKVAGIFFGLLRSAFTISVVLNLLAARSLQVAAMAPDMQEVSVLYGPLKAFAPLVVPALGEGGWAGHALDTVVRETGLPH